MPRGSHIVQKVLSRWKYIGTKNEVIEYHHMWTKLLPVELKRSVCIHTRWLRGTIVHQRLPKWRNTEMVSRIILMLSIVSNSFGANDRIYERKCLFGALGDFHAKEVYFLITLKYFRSQIGRLPRYSTARMSEDTTPLIVLLENSTSCKPYIGVAGGTVVVHVSLTTVTRVRFRLRAVIWLKLLWSHVRRVLSS